MEQNKNTTKKLMAEIVTGNAEKVKLSTKNAALFKAAAEVQRAFQYWKLVDRDSDKLNSKLDEIREKYKQ